MFPTRRRERHPPVSVEEAEGAADGNRTRRYDLRHRAAFGKGSGRSRDGAVCAFQRDTESTGARSKGPSGVCGGASSRRLAWPFDSLDGSCKVHRDQTESSDLKYLISQMIHYNALVDNPPLLDLFDCIVNQANTMTREFFFPLFKFHPLEPHGRYFPRDHMCTKR